MSHSAPTLQDGQLVLLKYPHSARYRWPLAKILQTYPDQDGVIRSVEVRCRGENYLRPVNQIVPLELDGEITTEEDSNAGSSDGTERRSREASPGASTPGTPAPTTPSSPGPTRTTPNATSQPADSSTQRSPTTTPARRPLRRAAVLQRQRMRDLIETGAV